MFKPTETKQMNGGIGKLYRFNNGYGASVVKHDFSYGGKSGLWELAVMKFHNDGSNDCDIDYSTHITSDVVGYCDENKIQDLLTQIREL